jgi:hypothetical protein
VIVKKSENRLNLHPRRWGHIGRRSVVATVNAGKKGEAQKKYQELVHHTFT